MVTFSRVRELNNDVVRNICKLRKDAFVDLGEDLEDADIANKAAQRVISDLDLHNTHHYQTAIYYPFDPNNFWASRYSDGTFPVWYGSTDLECTLHETAHHMVQEVMTVVDYENFNEEKIIRYRNVYDVFCNGILIDLTENDPSGLTTDDYQPTQAIARRLYKQGFPGLLAPSARDLNGINVNIFNRDILSNPRINCELSYFLYLATKSVEIRLKDRLIKEMVWA